MEGRTYRYMKQDALYPFGYGLSYTTYAYSNLTVRGEQVGEDGTDITVTVKIPEREPVRKRYRFT